VSFGRTAVDIPAPDNGEIHWESASAIWINEEILRRTGGSWQTPPHELRPNWRDYWRCRRFLWDFAGYQIALIKDPRMVLTYPVWQRVLPEHTLVMCLRHPLSVAKSLEKRDGISIEKGFWLWKEYNRHLLEYAKHETNVLWFDFDGGSEAVRNLVQAFSDRFGLAPTREALEYYQADARHHTYSSDLPNDVASLYDGLREQIANH
jgi:hypothetical protein